MKTLNSLPVPSDSKSRACFCSLFLTATLICSVYFLGTAFFQKERMIRWRGTEVMQGKESYKCKTHCRPSGTEELPRGIIAQTSNLEMLPLWGYSIKEDRLPRKLPARIIHAFILSAELTVPTILFNFMSNPSMNLLAIAVGIKQIEVVDKIVRKFLSSDFVVMLFHYDGVVDEWRALPWSDQVIHVSAVNQTKWWFGKRFLHPDIVSEYNYIFLWDEDIGVENFNPKRYLLAVEKEGLEVSQPALDPTKSKIHYPITARIRNSQVHRRMYKSKGSGRCDGNSTSPPCTGWVEMMAPVFSRAAWRCVWYMIQNDLIHEWGMDVQLGYCAQGDRSKNVGVVDSEYIVHLALTTLGVFNDSRTVSKSQKVDSRAKVRMQSSLEMQIFRKRWADAVRKDRCWVDPYQRILNQTRH